MVKGCYFCTFEKSIFSKRLEYVIQTSIAIQINMIVEIVLSCERDNFNKGFAYIYESTNIHKIMKHEHFTKCTTVFVENTIIYPLGALILIRTVNINFYMFKEQ